MSDATKGLATRFIKSLGSSYSLKYIRDGENTRAVLSTNKDNPWSNTGYHEDIEIYWEVGTSKSSLWNDVIHQIETSTNSCIEDYLKNEQI